MKPTSPPAHYGTGFFFNFCRAGTKHIPCIVTNKHVIDRASLWRIVFTVAEGDQPARNKAFNFNVDQFEQGFIRHPDPAVDLAVMPMAGLLAEAERQGHRFFYKAWEVTGVADDAFLADLGAVEDILMIGYPNGLWDKHNNRPLVRRGVTATPPYDDYEGRREFMIDCACFGGSSGSPIVLYNPSSFTTKDGNISMGTRIRLLGILFGGPIRNAEGSIIMKPIPTQTSKPVAMTPQMLNLVQCIKATELAWFEQDLASRGNAAQ